MDYTSKIEELGPDIISFKDSKYLWHAIERGTISKMYFAKRDRNEFILNIEGLVGQVLSERSSLIQIEGASSSDGFLVSYSPEDSFFDGISEEQTDGFFDNADAPPPEFWLGVENRSIIAYIPNKFRSYFNDQTLSSAELCLKLIDRDLSSNS